MENPQKSKENRVKILSNNIMNMKGYNIRELASDIGIGYSTFNSHYNGKRIPKGESVNKYAKYFGVSTDYILGKSDVPTNDKDIQFICEYTGLSKEAIECLHRQVENVKLGIDLYNNEYFVGSTLFNEISINKPLFVTSKLVEEILDKDLFFYLSESAISIENDFEKQEKIVDDINEFERQTKSSTEVMKYINEKGYNANTIKDDIYRIEGVMHEVVLQITEIIKNSYGIYDYETRRERLIEKRKNNKLNNGDLEFI